MPKKTDDTEPKTEEPKPKVKAEAARLTAYSVVIDGVDRTILARDEADRDAQIAKIRITFLP